MLRAPLWALLAPSFAAYVWLSYAVERSNFIAVAALFAALFSLYLLAMRAARTEQDYKIAFGASLIFRAALLFSLPNLSDDFYRFVWDGRLLARGENPFAKIPSAYSTDELAALGLDAELFSKLNSPNYFSVYPALCQLGFWLSAILSPSSLSGSVVVMKLYLFLFECGALFLLPKLCAACGIDKKNALLYALNPLVIVELCGNLHFEAVMIFFLVLALYLTSDYGRKIQKNVWLSGLALALSASAKLLPLLFLPVLTRRLGWSKGAMFAATTAGVVTALFAAVIPVSIAANFLSSIGLYFQTFEFNASFYALARRSGEQFLDYGVVSKLGAAFGAFSLVAVFALAVLRKPDPLPAIIETMLLSLATYFFFATTVHPWYLTTLVALSVFSRHRFAIVWSGMATLSYSTYQSVPYQEQVWLTAVEYIVVLGSLLVERRRLETAD